MKNKNIKKALFYITLIPYIILLFMCVYCAIIGYGWDLGKKAYGVIAIGNFLSYVYSDLILGALFSYPIITLCISILWIGYQIYYFISYKRNKNEKSVSFKEDDNYSKKSINFKKILFFICIICWIMYFAFGIFSFFFGVSAGGIFGTEMETIYGIEALKYTLFWTLIGFSLVPVLPFSLIYIIIYVIVNFYSKKKKEEKNSNNVDN